MSDEAAGVDDSVNAPNKFAGIADADDPQTDGHGLDAEKAGPQILPDKPNDEPPPDRADDPHALPNLDERD